MNEERLAQIRERVERQRVAIEGGEGIIYLMDNAIPYLLSQLAVVTAERDRLRKTLEAAEAVIEAFERETKWDNPWAHRRSQDAIGVWQQAQKG